MMRCAWLIGMVAATSGCFATVELRSGRDVDGEVVRGDDEHLYLKLSRTQEWKVKHEGAVDAFNADADLTATASDESESGVYKIPRAAIDSVDHPGFRGCHRYRCPEVMNSTNVAEARIKFCNPPNDQTEPNPG